MKVKGALSGLVLIAIAGMLWGTVTVGIKLLYQLGETTALTVGWLRLLIAGPTLYVLAWWFNRVSPWQTLAAQGLAGRGWLVLGAVCIAGYQVSLFAALNTMSATVGVVLALCSAPLFAAVLAGPILHEHIPGRLWLILPVAVVATALLSGLSDWSTLLTAGQGSVLAVTAGLCYAGYALIARKMVGQVGPWPVVAIAFAGGAVLLTPLVVWQGGVANFGPAGWGLLIYLGLGPTALGYVLYSFGMRHTPAATATFISLLEPLTAALLAFFLLGERLSAGQWLGAAILLAAFFALPRQ